jgi:LacI family transcriptional regulator, fructose operon transcriptional repressor
LKLEEVAKLAGVSKTTVSSVLNGKSKKYRISQETQDKVRGVVDKYGYQPNHAAAALRKGTSKTLGFVIPDFENRSYMRIAKRLEVLAHEGGYQLVISSSDDVPSMEKSVVTRLVKRGIDCLLVSSCLADAGEFYGEINTAGTPVIGLDRPLPEDCFTNIVSEDYKSAYELTQSLALPATSHICLLGALPQLMISKEREAGFRAVAESVPYQTVSVHYGESFEEKVGFELCQEMEESGSGFPNAVLTTSFNLFQGVIKYLQQCKPQWLYSDTPMISLATFGNGYLLDFVPLQVNSLPQQYELIAESAWKAANNAMKKKHKPEQIIVPRKLILRSVQIETV